jgi:hypothetical protein
LDWYRHVRAIQPVFDLPRYDEALEDSLHAERGLIVTIIECGGPSFRTDLIETNALN